MYSWHQCKLGTHIVVHTLGHSLTWHIARCGATQNCCTYVKPVCNQYYSILLYTQNTFAAMEEAAAAPPAAAAGAAITTNAPSASISETGAALSELQIPPQYTYMHGACMELQIAAFP